MSATETRGYAGDVAATEVWKDLQSNPAAVLVDVRTTAEWNYVGIPALGSLDKRPLLVEWQMFPSMAVDQDFVAKLETALVEAGVATDAPIYFLCRSGVRSKAAAIAMTATGYTRCLNVEGGFEGPLDHEGHRGRIAGWKASGLPWAQS